MNLWDKLIRKSRPVPACVQTARLPFASGNFLDLQSLRPPECRLYDQLRSAVPMIDAAILKIVRLVGSFQLSCESDQATRLLRNFAANVPVGPSQIGIDAFFARYLDDLITYGGAAGEIVLSPDADDIRALYNSPLDHIEAAVADCPIQAAFYIRDSSGLHLAPMPELILYTALNPPAGELRGISLLRGLPFIGETLLRIYDCIGKNFERIGNVRFAITYHPGPQGADPITARDTAQDIAREWSEAMSAPAESGVRDFVAVGDVDVKVIGADNQLIDTKIPVDQMLQQIVSKLGLPPFLLGLSWSTTERMSKQQADILTSELESYRRLLTPVALKICRTFLGLHGIAEDISLDWDMINLQDEVDSAQAQLYLAQAAALSASQKEASH